MVCLLQLRLTVHYSNGRANRGPLTLALTASHSLVRALPAEATASLTMTGWWPLTSLIFRHGHQHCWFWKKSKQQAVDKPSHRSRTTIVHYCCLFSCLKSYIAHLLTSWLLPRSSLLVATNRWWLTIHKATITSGGWLITSQKNPKNPRLVNPLLLVIIPYIINPY